jgi:hypothetical protein
MEVYTEHDWPSTLYILHWQIYITGYDIRIKGESREQHLCTCGNRAMTDDGGDVATNAAAVAMAAAASSELSEYYMSPRPPPLRQCSATAAARRRRHCAAAAGTHMQCSIMSSPYVASI